jgi:uncharacterized protein YdhG (YjbR/CyaY superfamily)
LVLVGITTMNAKSPKNIDEYIAGFPSGVQEVLRQMRRAVRAAAPEAEEALKYRIPTFVMGENLVHFAAFKNHIGWYPTHSAIGAFQQELRAYKTSKGAVQFRLGEPIPFALIKRMVRFRVKEARARAAAKVKKVSKQQ